MSGRELNLVQTAPRKKRPALELEEDAVVLGKMQQALQKYGEHACRTRAWSACKLDTVALDGCYSYCSAWYSTLPINSAGMTAFRGRQEEAILAAMQGNRVQWT